MFFTFRILKGDFKIQRPMSFAFDFYIRQLQWIILLPENACVAGHVVGTPSLRQIWLSFVDSRPFPERFCTANSGFHLSAKTNIPKSPNLVFAEQRLTAVKVWSQPKYFLCIVSVWSMQSFDCSLSQIFTLIVKLLSSNPHACAISFLSMECPYSFETWMAESPKDSE